MGSASSLFGFLNIEAGSTMHGTCKYKRGKDVHARDRARTHAVLTSLGGWVGSGPETKLERVGLQQA